MAKKTIEVSYRVFDEQGRSEWITECYPKTVARAKAIALKLSLKYYESDVIVENEMGDIVLHDIYKDGKLEISMM